MNQDCIIQCTLYVTKNESEMRGLCQLQKKICKLQRPNKTMEIREEHMTVKLFRNLNNLTLRLLMSYIYGAPSKARNANVVYIWTYVWQR